MMMSCQEASKWASQALDAPVTGLRRFQIRLHLTLCHSCRSMDALMRLLQTAGRKIDEDPSVLIFETLSDSARARITLAIRKRRSPDHRSS